MGWGGHLRHHLGLYIILRHIKVVLKNQMWTHIIFKNTFKIAVTRLFLGARAPLELARVKKMKTENETKITS